MKVFFGHPGIELTLLRERLKYVLISMALTLISRYRGSCSKGALCRPFQSLAKDVQPHYLFSKGIMDLTTNLGRESNFNSQLGTK